MIFDIFSLRHQEFALNLVFYIKRTEEALHTGQQQLQTCRKPFGNVFSSVPKISQNISMIIDLFMILKLILIIF